MSIRVLTAPAWLIVSSIKDLVMVNIRKKLRFTALLALVFIVIAVPLLYFFAWRPSDAAYETADKHLKTLAEATDSITKPLGDTYSIHDIDNTLTTALREHVDTYVTTLDLLSKDSAFVRDPKLKASYEEHRESMVKFSKDADGIADGLTKYRALLLACGNFVASELETIKTVKSFDAAADSCQLSLQNAEAVASSTFVSQFLGEYTALSKELLAAYREGVEAGSNRSAQTAATSKVTTIKQRITTLSEKELDIRIASPVSSLQKLQDTLSTQAKAILR